MDYPVLNSTLAAGARRPNRLHTDNTDETATIRAGTGFKLRPGAGLIRHFRTINRQNQAAAHQKVAPQELE